MRPSLPLLAALLTAAGPALALAPLAPKTPLDRALALHRAGRLEEAVVAYRALAASAPDPATLAAAHNNACAALNDLGRYREALPDCRAAERLRRAAGGPALADSLVNLGLALDSLGETAAAEAAYREALALYRAAGRREDEALVISNLASLAIGSGALGRALDWLDQGERLARAAAGEPWAEEELRIGHVNRAVALERLGAYREALAELRAGAGGAGAGGAAEAATRTLDVAVLYRNLGDPWRALAELDRAEAQLGGLDDRSLAATLALNRGLVRLLNLADPAAAAVEFERALALARQAGDRREEGRALAALGRARLDAGALDDAERAFRAALAVATAALSRETRWSALGGLGRVAAARGDADAALARLREAIAAVEEVGAGVGEAALREGLLADQRELYAAAVDLLAGRGEAAAALALAERARARELLEAISGTAAAPLDEAALAALGRERGPLLACFAGTRKLWRFRLDREGVTVVAAGDADAVLGDARAAAAALAARREPEPALLTRLGRALLPAESAGWEHLIVVPDGALFYLPFERLAPAGEGPALVERTAVAYAPSLSVLARLGRATAEPALDVAAFADPELPAGGPVGAATLLAGRFGLPPLPAARAEAAAAAARLGGRSRVAFGADASEAALARTAAAGAHLLLVAAHTLVDERLRGGAAIFLAAGGGEDGVVTPAELAARPFAADLAVLSGCRTALAGRRDGRSLATLSGALLAAGARGVVATLREVPDRAAAALMDAFFWELGRGTAPAEALRRAKLRLLRDPRWAGRADDWSAFVLIGDPPPVSAPRRGWRLAALGALALAAAAALILGARRGGRPGLSAPGGGS